MTEVRYERNSAGLAEVLLSGDMSDAMMTYGFLGMSMFHTIAPRRTNQYATGGELRPEIQAAPTPRQVVQLIATRGYSATVEWGNHQGHHGHYVLATVVDSIEASG